MRHLNGRETRERAPSAIHSAVRASSAETPSPNSSYIFHQRCFFSVRLPSQRSLNMEPRQASTSWKFSCPPHSPPAEHIWRLQVGVLPLLTKEKGFSLGPGRWWWWWSGDKACVTEDAHLLWAMWRGRAEPGIFPNSLPAAPQL